MNKTAHPDEDGTPVTPPLPDRIAAAIDNYRARCRTLDEADCYGSMDRASYDEQRKGVLDARDALNAAIAEVYAEREQYRAVVARQIEDKRRLLAERNEARAVLALVAGNLAAWSEKREEAPASAGEHMDEAMHALVRFRPEGGGYSEAASKLRLEMLHGEVYAERDAANAQRDELRADVRDLTDTLHRNGFRRCDAMACNCNSWHHVDGFAARFREIDEAVGEHNGKTLLCAVEEKLADLDQCVREREALAKSYRETVDERDAIARHRDQLIEICRRDSDAAHEAVLSGRANKLKWGAMLVRDAVAELVEQRAAANAQRDELLRIVKLWREWGGHEPTCEFVRARDSNPLIPLHLLVGYCDCGWDAAGVAIARAQSGQPAQRDDDLSKHDDHCNCERCR